MSAVCSVISFSRTFKFVRDTGSLGGAPCVIVTTRPSSLRPRTVAYGVRLERIMVSHGREVHTLLWSTYAPPLPPFSPEACWRR